MRPLPSSLPIRAVCLGVLWLCGFGPAAPAQPALQSRDGELSVIAGEHGPRVVDGRGFSNPMLLPEEVDLNSLAAIRAGWVAAGSQPVAGRRELYLRMLDAGGLKRLPNPSPLDAERPAPLRTEPVILSREGRVEGLVWLEGEHRDALRVVFSVWLGITWSHPETIDAEAPGGALALDVALLEDGSWLLVWAGFDGEDDEIWWSLVIDGAATAPLPLTDNAVPDILPSVTALGSDALVAWNAYDGEEYRVEVARMTEGRWGDARAEPSGSFEPLLLDREGVPTLVYFRYGAGGSASWELSELDAEGLPLRRSSVPAQGRDRPLVRPIDGHAHLQWPTDGERRRLDWVEQR